MAFQAEELRYPSYADLVAEAKRRIVRYTPEWTDFNESDPGITLVELFAWMTESMLWQMSRVPDHSYMKFLELIGLTPRPAQPARAHLTFEATPGATGVAVPAGSRFAAPGDDGANVIFETDESLDLLGPRLTSLVVGDRDHREAVTSSNEEDERPFYPFGQAPRIDNALYLGFGERDPDGAAPAADLPGRLRLRVFLPRRVRGGRPGTAADGQVQAGADVQLVWQARTGAGPSGWETLQTYRDETRGFLHDGYVVIGLPRRFPYSALADREGEKERLWLRCRLAAGAYPPGQAPQVDMIRPNCVPATSLTSVTLEELGRSDGRPNQVFALQNRDVQPDSLALEVRTKDAVEPWQRCEEVFAAGPDDRVFVLDPDTGQVSFGDGRRGRIPDYDAVIVARRYRYGGGTRGNVRSGAIATPLTHIAGVKSVTNPRMAEGGRDRQPLDELKADAPTALRNKQRAVSRDDYVALARSVVGVRDATILPLHNPNHPGTTAPGCVTVVVVPDVFLGDSLSPVAPPRMTEDTMRRVAGFLGERRGVAVELYVAEPQYPEVRVDVALLADPTVSDGELREACIKRINTFILPALASADDETIAKGAMGFGAEILPVHLYARFDDIPGLKSIAGLKIFVDDIERDATCPIAIAPDAIAWPSHNHVIQIGRVERDR